jgi:hypothetical protein
VPGAGIATGVIAYAADKAFPRERSAMTFEFGLPFVASVYRQVAAGELDVCIQFTPSVI